MFREPLFQQDILKHIIKYMSFYLGYEHWFLIFCAVLFFIYCCYKVLMYKNEVSYASNFDSKVYPFSYKDIKAVYGFMFLILCLVYNIFGIFNQEMSLFANYDTRYHVILLFNDGGLPMWAVEGRFYPLAFWDTRIVYALTHNFFVINTYLSIQSVIIAWLLNCFLKFLPVWKRFLCIGLIMISPAVFSISSIVFSERLLLMYIIGSLICMQKFSEQSDKKYFLWFAILLINCALFSKELCVLFYFGILVYYSLGLILSGKIVPASFLSPIKTARTYPFETLLFLSIASFVSLYLIYMYTLFDSRYLFYRLVDFWGLCKLYYIEIIITTIVLILFVKKLFCSHKCIFMEAMAFGCIFLTIFLIFVLKLGQTVPCMAYLSYYLIIPSVIGMMYILWHIKNKYLLIFICCGLFVNSLLRNEVIRRHQDGVYYRELAEALMLENKEPQMNVFLANHMEYNIWYIRSFVLPYKYYWPKKHINFFSSETDENVIKIYGEDNIFHKEKPSFGDYYVMRKDEHYFEDLQQISDMNKEKIFENKMFEVYLIK